jgi:DNA-binding MarR family transcriptional regulator
MASRQKAPKDKAQDSIDPAAPRPVVKPFRFGFLVHDVSRMRRTLFDEVMRSRGVTRSQWSVLATLSRVGRDGMMQVDLSRHMDVGKVTIGGLIDRLEAAGLVDRRLDVNDRRARRVFITAKGFEVIAEMQKVGNKLNKSILAGVPTEHQRITEETLAQVKSNIRQMLQEH